MPPEGRGLVLVAEDERPIADLLAMYLRREGFGVQLAATGPDALAAARRLRPVAVILDVGLPGMDGTEVCRRIRALGGARPVMVALTGWGKDEDRRRTGEAGFDHHLVKPVAPEALAALLQTAQAAVGRS